LEHVASNALNSDPLLAGAEFAALYMPEEIVAAIEAAQEAKLSTEGESRISFSSLLPQGPRHKSAKDFSNAQKPRWSLAPARLSAATLP
jgi:hypothetical protein